MALRKPIKGISRRYLDRRAKHPVIVQRRFKAGEPHAYGTPQMDYEVPAGVLTSPIDKVGSKPQTKGPKPSGSIAEDSCCTFPEVPWNRQTDPCLHDCHFPPVTAKEWIADEH